MPTPRAGRPQPLCRLGPPSLDDASPLPMCEEDTPGMFLEVRFICFLLRLQRGSGCGCWDVGVCLYAISL